MSLSTQYKYALLKELPAGIHLVMISEVSLVKDENGQVIRSEDKGVRVKVQFIAMNPEIKRFEQRFWAKSSLMLKMCEAFKIDALAQRFDLEAVEKRGYVAIKEVRSVYIDNKTPWEFYIFDFFPWEESLKVPKIDESLFVQYIETEKNIKESIGNRPLELTSATLSIMYLNEMDKTIQQFDIVPAQKKISAEANEEPFQSISQKLKPKPKKDGPINWTDL